MAVQANLVSSMLKGVLSQPNFSPQTNATQKTQTFPPFPHKFKLVPFVQLNTTFMFVLTLTDDKLLKFVLILGEEERKFEFFVLRLFGEKSLAGSEPLLAYYYADFSVSHFLKFATSKNEVANFKIPHPQNQLTSPAKPSAKHALPKTILLSSSQLKATLTIFSVKM